MTGNQHTPSRNPASRRSRVLATTAAAALVAAGALGANLLSPQTPAYATQAITAQAPVQAPISFADLVEKVKPAVVSVRVKIENASADDDDNAGQLEDLPPQLRDFFKRFGGENGMPQPGQRGPRSPRAQQGQGSGFFISSDGYLVTNNHVVDNATKVEVVTDDGRTLDAKVIGTDPKTDLALVKVSESGDFPYVKLAGGKPRVGDWVVAIGNPFGLGGTVTAGIVSAQHRDIGSGPYDDYLQIDAPINRGNSGGPTFNLNGEVVGVNTAIFSPSGGNVGLAFAIPSSTVNLVVDQLKENGRVDRGYLGVQIQGLTDDLADSLGLQAKKGALVAEVQQNTPAAKAGFKSGDLITAVNGDPIADAKELTRTVGAMKPGSRVEVSYLRDGKTQSTTVELGTLPGDKAAQANPAAGNSATPKLGLRLAPAENDEGVAVADVDPDGPAAAKGIKKGDVIVEVGGRAVSKPSDVQAGIEAAKKEGRKAVLLRLKSGQGTRFVALAFPQA